MGSVDRPGLGLGDVIHQGGNSGYQALNLLFHFGVSRVALLGFDMGPSPDGKAHWFGQHRAPLGTRQPFDVWLAKFPALAADLARRGVDVINCSRATRLECFPRRSLSEVLDEARA